MLVSHPQYTEHTERHTEHTDALIFGTHPKTLDTPSTIEHGGNTTKLLSTQAGKQASIRT